MLLQVGSRAVRIRTMGDHGGGKVGVRSESLRPKVVEHGVRAPPSKDLGSSGVNASTQESGSSIWAEAFDGQEMGGHTSGILNGFSADTEAAGDQVVGDITPPSRGSKIVAVERSVRRSPIEEEMTNNPAQGPSRAEERIARGSLGDEFVLDTVLLFSKEDPHRLNAV